MQWQTFRDSIRRTILNDTTSTTYKWSNTDLLDYLSWTLNALCMHTAVATATSFTGDGETTAFPIPDNCFEDITMTGAVYVQNGTTRTYMNPVKTNQLQRADSGYYVLNGEINLLEAPGEDETVELHYFAYYPTPVLDTDQLTFPAWAQAAISFRIGAYAMTKYATKFANINQWNRNTDKGNPEDSSMWERALAYQAMWDQELARMPAQRRENFFRET